MGRDEWDKLLDSKVAKYNMPPLAPLARTLVLNYLSTHFGDETGDWQGLPPGPGREEVFYLCQACHSLAIVKQQGLDRETWDETLVWMVEEQEMPEPEPEERDLMLGYLSTHFGRDTAK